MSLHGTKNEPPEAAKMANVGPKDLTTNEKQPLPWTCGEEKVALMWVGQVYDQFTIDAPIERPGKK